MKNIIIGLTLLLIVPGLAYATGVVNSITGDDSTITCSPTMGFAKCKVNQQSDFFFGGTFFGIDTGSAVVINPAILWLTNDLPMFSFGSEDGHEGFNMTWEVNNGFISITDHAGDDVAIKATLKDSLLQGEHILQSSNGTCFLLSVSNAGVLSTASTTCH